MLLTVKSNQKTLQRQIGAQFQGKRQIPFTATGHEKRHRRDTTWQLRAKEAPEHIKVNWLGSSWIVEVIPTITTGKRQRWSMDNEWHWARDAQLGEDAHRYAHRTGVAVFSFLRTIVMNLLRRAGYRSIRQGFREVAYDIKRRLVLGGVMTADTTT